MYLIFDTETTGKADFNRPPTDACQPRLVQLGALLLDEKFETMAELNAIVKPDGYIISDVVAKIHGIDQATAERYGLPEPIVLAAFAELLRRADYLIAHNITFDGIVLGRAFDIHKSIEAVLPPNKKCTMLAMTPICKLPGRSGDSKWPTLQEAHLHCFGKQFDGAHDAMADVRACARIYQWIVQGGKTPDPLSEPVENNDGYNDDTPMPFGKHRGKKLQHVPADYLHWLWGQRPLSDKKLESYIRENMSALKDEYPDGIWS